MRHAAIIGGAVFVLIGLGGMGLGVVRILGGEMMHGLANFIIGGFVALHGYGTIREEV